MAKPNSQLTRFLAWAARKIDPKPDVGEAWCVECVMNAGRTIVLPSGAIWNHVKVHRREAEDNGCSSKLRIRVSSVSRPAAEAGDDL